MARLIHRGVMFDLARGMERKDYYRDLLPHLRDWGYNRLHLHLADDQGCRLVFPSHPEFASVGAFTADEIRALQVEARRCNIEILPEIETLGHTLFITGHPAWRDLGGAADTRRPMNAIDPKCPRTRRLLGELLRDMAGLFDGPILHAGLDEVDFSALPRYRNRPPQDLWPVFAGHAAWVHDTIRSLGKRPAMWGDHLLSARPMAEKFGSDVLIFDWHYQPDVDPASLDFFERAGFEVWAAPATVWWYVRLLPGPGVFRNLREFSAHAAQPQRRRVTGIVNTVWCPWRFLPGALDWPLAWAGRLFASGEERADFCRQFCRDFYGLARDPAAGCAEALSILHGLAPDTPRLDAVMAGGALFTRERRRECRAALPLLTGALRRLERAERRARRHAERLHDVTLSARILERWAARGAGGFASRPSPLAECRARWNIARPYPTPVYEAAGRWQHVLRLAAGLARVRFRKETRHA